ncbi:hypothetical protein M0811_10278 [Anaeramoeba ignava]|uniref:Uncharacterized protein n=1 Tax=Anaeramoeba ignava TaxID=1746090 RepID=A0A9Q0LHR9_ANAIG|nr:hypothetical protein M0811_10278 [Anaeramoeba ignava]
MLYNFFETFSSDDEMEFYDNNKREKETPNLVDFEKEFNSISQEYKSLFQEMEDHIEEFRKYKDILNGSDSYIVRKHMVKKLEYFIDSILCTIPQLFLLDCKDPMPENSEKKNLIELDSSQLHFSIQSHEPNLDEQNQEAQVEKMKQQIPELIQTFSNFLKKRKENPSFFHSNENDPFKEFKETQNPLKEKIVNFRVNVSELLYNLQRFISHESNQEVKKEMNQVSQLSRMKIKSCSFITCLDNFQNKINKINKFPPFDTLIEKLDSLAISVYTLIHSTQIPSENLFKSFSKRNPNISIKSTSFQKLVDFLNSSIKNFGFDSSKKNHSFIELLFRFFHFIDLILDLLGEQSSISFLQKQESTKNNKMNSQEIQHENDGFRLTLNSFSQLSLNSNEIKSSQQQHYFVKIGILNVESLKSNQINNILSNLVNNYQIDILMLQNLKSPSLLKINNFQTFSDEGLYQQTTNLKEILRDFQPTKTTLSFLISSNLIKDFEPINVSADIPRERLPTQIKKDEFRYQFNIIQIGELVLINFLDTSSSPKKLLIDFCDVLEKLFPKKLILIGGFFPYSFSKISTLFERISPQSQFHPVRNIIDKSSFVDSFAFSPYFLTNDSTHFSFSRNPFLFHDPNHFSNIDLQTDEIFRSSIILNDFQFSFKSN